MALIQKQNTRLLVIMVVVVVLPACIVGLYPLFLFLILPAVTSPPWTLIWNYHYWTVASLAWLVLLCIILPLMRDVHSKDEALVRPQTTVDLKDFRKSVNYGSVGDRQSIQSALKEPLAGSEQQQNENPEVLHSLRHASSNDTFEITNKVTVYNENSVSLSSVDSNDPCPDKPIEDKSANTQGTSHEQKRFLSYGSSNDSFEIKIRTNLETRKSDVSSDSNPSEEAEQAIGSPLQSTEHDTDTENSPVQTLQITKDADIHNDIEPTQQLNTLPKLDMSKTDDVFECSLPTPLSAKEKNQVFIFLPEHN